MKKAARKLVLARETLKVLSDRSLKAAAGGLSGGCLVGTNNLATCAGAQCDPTGPQ